MLLFGDKAINGVEHGLTEVEKNDFREMLERKRLMLLDATNRDEVSKDLSGDVVIIGAGTIGLFLAACLARANRQVILVEGGGRVADTVQNALTAQSRGKQHNGVVLGRATGLGGTSVLWGGQLAEFEETDLRSEDACWPISLAELRGWYEHVYDRLGIRQRSTTAEYRRRFGGEIERSENIERFFTFWMAQPNFAKLFKREIMSSAAIRVILNATVNDIGFIGARAEIVLADTAARQLQIRGNDFVFATGTIATSRFFLSTQRRSPVPWKYNRHIGCYFQDHLGGKIADVEVLDEIRFREFFENALADGVKLQPKLRFTAEARAQLPTGICGVFSFDSEIGKNIANIKSLIRTLKSGTTFSGFETLPGDVLALGRALVPLVIHYVRDHRVLALFDRALEYHVQAEQYPISRSRITLLGDGPAGDGLFRANIDWQIDGREIETICCFARSTDSYLQKHGIARLRLAKGVQSADPAFLDQLSDTYHPCGGMRMSTASSAGAVDPDCRVWDTLNVYIAGASVFPSSSHANCTLTALTLAARLSDTLSKSH